MKHVTFKLLSVAVAAVLAPSLASAQSADLTMDGVIVPGACTPVFSNGGVIDLGRHSASTLNATVQTLLPDSDAVSLTVTCTAPAAVVVRLNDNNVATVERSIAIPGIAGLYSFYYGLGEVDGVNIGAYALLVEDVSVDGVGMLRLSRNDGHAPGWVVWNNFLRSYTTVSPWTVSWGASAAAGPASGLVHTLSLKARPAIRKGEDLPLTSEIPLTGSVSFVVRYL